jgi:hypothetical protein
MAMFCAGISFVNFAYFFYLPLTSSLIIAFSSAADEEFAARTPAEAQPVPASRWPPVAARRPVPLARG